MADKKKKPSKRAEIASKIEDLADDPLVASDDAVVRKLQRLANEIREADSQYRTGQVPPDESP
jgi:hypothetical protein